MVCMKWLMRSVPASGVGKLGLNIHARRMKPICVLMLRENDWKIGAKSECQNHHKWSQLRVPFPDVEQVLSRCES